MNLPEQPAMELDLHCLEPRYAATRVAAPKRLNALIRSIGEIGQVVPVLVVAEGEGYVLIDGYRRLEALRRCGLDTARASCWQGSVEQALLMSLAHQQARPWEALEQAQLLRLLCEGGLSRHALARHTGRDVSWVSRRLQLLEGMNEALLDALRRGVLTTWSATRVVMPLARANAEHARWLVQALEKEPLAARVLSDLYRHYARSDRQTREHLVRHPQLFAKARLSQQQSREAARLRQGPEGEWKEKLRWIDERLRQLRRQAPSLFTDSLEAAQRCELLRCVEKTRRAFQQLEQVLAPYHSGAAERCDTARGDGDDIGGKRTDHPRAVSATGVDTSDLSVAEGLTRGGAAGAACAATQIGEQERRLAMR